MKEVFEFLNKGLYTLGIIFTILVLSGCKTESAIEEEPDTLVTERDAPLSIPPFNRDSAYQFIEQQLAFGPRNPGSPGIIACRDWMVEKLEAYGADVIRQHFVARFHDGSSAPSENIIGQFNVGNPRRMILAAHYDTRAIAEEDEDPAMRDKPIMGADDGASGVGVILEIARLISENAIDLGIDIIFFDAEDQGIRNDARDPDYTSWCLGAQHWSRNPHRSGYRARYGILLDMVGARNAFFNKENVTNLYPHADQVHQIYDKVWNLANAMGKGRYFQNRRISPIIDDHYFVNLITGIPMIDIINKPPGSGHGFGPHWHTHADDISIIDKNTLAAVGQVVTAVIYRDAAGRF